MNITSAGNGQPKVSLVLPKSRQNNRQFCLPLLQALNVSRVSSLRLFTDMDILETLIKFFRRVAWAVLPKSFSKHIDSDSILADAICLIIAVLAIILFGYLFMYLAEQVIIDSCLDSGGKWDNEPNTCIN